MSAHPQAPEDLSSGDPQGLEGPSGFAAIVPTIVMLAAILGIVAIVGVAGAIWAAVVAALATITMAAFVMRWTNRITKSHD
jgi:hypothetical protein